MPFRLFSKQPQEIQEHEINQAISNVLALQLACGQLKPKLEKIERFIKAQTEPSRIVQEIEAVKKQELKNLKGMIELIIKEFLEIEKFELESLKK
ncbi:hypothetical protein GF327_01650 [Candidatus Woesearchaeota archaeon]|nr:hypothetical protein [Candidatus Woesearchaeota archaeon]